MRFILLAFFKPVTWDLTSLFVYIFQIFPSTGWLNYAAFCEYCVINMLAVLRLPYILILTVGENSLIERMNKDISQQMFVIMILSYLIFYLVLKK